MKRLGWFITVLLGLSLFYPWATHLFNHWVQLQPIKPMETPKPVSPAISYYPDTDKDIPVKPATKEPPSSRPNPVPFQPREDLKPPPVPESTNIPPKLQPPPSPTFIEIPALGIKRTVYEGSSPGNLRRGPSHMLESAAYGKTGICLIAGHRTTYGAPFRQIDRLTPGDTIIIRNQTATYVYIVQDQLVVEANYKTDFYSDTQELYLSTCHPPHSAKKRLLIRCRLHRAL